MALTETEREWIKATAREVAFEAVKEATSEMIKLHLASCPYGLAMGRVKWLLVGVAATLVLNTGGVVAVVKLLL